MNLLVNRPNGPASAHAYTGGKPFDPALPCVVFIHGALHDHSVWTLLARWCAHHGHSVLALDLPGQATLVGHSMGSLIGLEAAARAPALVGRLVMVGTAYPMKVSEALLNTARDTPLKAIDMVNAFSISTLAAKPGFPGPGMWLHGSNRALMRRSLSGPNAIGCAVNLFHHDFSVCDAYTGGLDAAAKVTAKVTLVLGAADQMTPPRATRELAAALKAKTVVLPSGHSLPAEVPDELLAALRGALA